MGNLCSKPTREVTSQEQSPPIMPHGVGAPAFSSQRSSTKPGLTTAQVGGGSLPERPTPSSRGPSSDHGQISADTSRRRPTTSRPPRRPLNSTVRQAVSEHPKFRILVVGKPRSGKSSLINAVFKVDAAAEPKDARGKADINIEFHPVDNRYLVVHYSGLKSQPGDSQNLQTIRDFILHRTNASRSTSERLHAVWICVTASDAIAGRLGEGVKEILGMRTVPVILVLTKFDMVVPEVGTQQREHARARAFAKCEDSCRRLFDKDPRDKPVAIVSERYADLIEELVRMTDKFIMGAPRSSKKGFGAPAAQGERSRASGVPLAWSAALRVCPDIIHQASNEVGRSRYWRRLWSSVDFDDHSLKSCVDVIHADLVETWNLNDKTRYLSRNKFKAKMSHLVKDFVGPADASIPTEARVEFADWVNDVYNGSQKNVRCVMGYIIYLTVILDAIFHTTPDDITPERVQLVIDTHVHSDRRNRIHSNIQEFVKETETPALRISIPTDLILEGIIDLIQQSCVPSTSTRSG